MAERFIRMKDLINILGVCRSKALEISRLDDFPAKRVLHGEVEGWLESEVDAWLQSRQAA